MKRRIVLIPLGVIALLLLTAGILVWWSGRSGSGTLEGWIGSEIQEIVNSRLKPQLHFKDLDYQYPGTVTIRDVQLADDDPQTPGQTINIISCSVATLTLGEIPTRGKPIIIEKLAFSKPVIRVQSVAPRSDEVIGFSNMLRSAPTTRNSKQGPKTNLSDVLRIRLIRLEDAAVIYDQRMRGTEPMVLNHITTDINVEPDQAGWYRLDADIARKPVFDLKLAGLLNLDDLNTRDVDLSLTTDLNDGKIDYLPAQLQRLLHRHDVRGKLAMKVTGKMPLRTPEAGEMETTATLSDANVAIGDYHVPIQKMELTARLRDGRVIVPIMKASALSGNAELSGAAILNDMLDGHVRLEISQVVLQEFLATKEQDGTPTVAGKLDANLQASGPLRAILAKTNGPATRPASTLSRLQATPLPDQWGSGAVRVTDGRLVKLPVIQTITNAVATASKIVTLNRSSADNPNDRLTVKFDLKKDRAKISEMEYLGSLVGAVGDGEVELDGGLDLMVHGGPIERIRGTLGRTVGKTVGALAGQIVSYRVAGSLDEPTVHVAVGGETGQKLREMFQSAGSQIGEAIQGLFGGK